MAYDTPPAPLSLDTHAAAASRTTAEKARPFGARHWKFATKLVKTRYSEIKHRAGRRRWSAHPTTRGKSITMLLYARQHYSWLSGCHNTTSRVCESLGTTSRYGPLTAPRRSDWRRKRHPGASAGRAARARGRPCRRDRRAAPAVRVVCGSSPPRMAARAPPENLPTAEHPHPGQGLHLPVKPNQVKSTQVKSSQVRSGQGLHLPGLLPEILNHVDAHRPNQTSSEAIRRHQGERTEEILDHVDAHPLAPTRRALDCASMLDGGEPRP